LLWFSSAAIYFIDFRLRQSTIQAMSIKISLHGIEVEASTAAEALEIIRGMTNLKDWPPSVVPPKAKSAHQVNTATLFLLDPDELRMANRFLEALKKAGPDGVSTDTVAMAVGVDHPKAVGGRMARINNLLEAFQLDQRNIYSNLKTANGRIWKPRRGIDSAISQISQQLAVYS
jgi:Trp operon repressor